MGACIARRGPFAWCFVCPWVRKIVLLMPGTPQMHQKRQNMKKKNSPDLTSFSAILQLFSSTHTFGTGFRRSTPVGVGVLLDPGFGPPPPLPPPCLGAAGPLGTPGGFGGPESCSGGPRGGLGYLSWSWGGGLGGRFVTPPPPPPPASVTLWGWGSYWTLGPARPRPPPLLLGASGPLGAPGEFRRPGELFEETPGGSG